MPAKQSPNIEELGSAERRLFDFLVRVANKELRCPTNQELREAGLSPERLAFLRRSGYIEVTTYSRTERVVKICAGNQAGATTKAPEREIDQEKHYREPAKLTTPDWNRLT